MFEQYNSANGEDISPADLAVLQGLQNPDRIKRERPFEFTEDFQECLLAGLLSEPEAFRRLSFIQVAYFTQLTNQLILRLARGFWQEYGTLPSPTELEEMVRADTKGKPSQAAYLVQLEMVLSHVGRCNMEFIYDKAQAFAEHQQLLLAGAKFCDLMAQGKRAEAKAAMREAIDFKLLSDDKGYLTPFEILKQNDVKWLATGLIPSGALCCLAGEPGLGKSFLALNLAWSVASGHKFLDSYEVEQGLVVYITCENRQGLGKRLVAYNQYFGSVPNDNFVCINGQYGLNNASDLNKVLAIIDGLPAKPLLIVIDTVNRYLCGNENDAKDMSLFVAGLTTLQQRYDCTLLAVHHTGKDASKKERGHTSLKGACETMMMLESDERLTCYKQKDAKEFAPLALYKHDVAASCIYLKLSDIEAKELYGQFIALFHDEWQSLSEVKYKELCSQATAYRWVVKAVKAGHLSEMIRKDGTHCYCRL